MGDDEDRLSERRIVTPPALPGVIAPRASGGWAELPSTHDLGADVRDRLAEHVIADVLFAALHARVLAPRFQLNEPVVKPFASFAKRLLLGLIGPGNVAVQ